MAIIVWQENESSRPVVRAVVEQLYDSTLTLPHATEKEFIKRFGRKAAAAALEQFYQKRGSPEPRSS